MSTGNYNNKKQRDRLVAAIREARELEIPGTLSRHLRLNHDGHEQVFNLDTLQKRSALMVRDLGEFLEVVAPQQYHGEIQGGLQGYLEAVMHFREVMETAGDHRRRPEGVVTQLAAASSRLQEAATVLGKQSDKIREIITELEPGAVRGYQQRLEAEYGDRALELMQGAHALQRGRLNELGLRSSTSIPDEGQAGEHREAIGKMMAKRRLQNISMAPDAIAPMMVGMVYLADAMNGALGKLKNRPMGGPD